MVWIKSKQSDQNIVLTMDSTQNIITVFKSRKGTLLRCSSFSIAGSWPNLASLVI